MYMMGDAVGSGAHTMDINDQASTDPATVAEARRQALESAKLKIPQSHVEGDGTYFRPTITALADQVIPALGPEKLPSQLSRSLGGGVTMQFADHVIDLVRMADGVRFSSQPLNNYTSHDAQTVLAEMDAQADAVDTGKRFHQLTSPQQVTILEAALGTAGAFFTNPTISTITITVTPAEFQALAIGLVTLVKMAYWDNFPFHDYRRNLVGWGWDLDEQEKRWNSKLKLTDVPNAIAKPHAGNIGYGSAFDFILRYQPYSIGVETLVRLAMLEADNTNINPGTGNPYHVDSEAAYVQLLIDDAIGALMSV